MSTRNAVAAGAAVFAALFSVRASIRHDDWFAFFFAALAGVDTYWALA